jgi:hypothetical protein
MKNLVLVFGLVVSSTAFGGGDYKGYKGASEGGYTDYVKAYEMVLDGTKELKGYNYKRHYRKAHFVRFMNRTFNLNNCKGKSHHSS